MWRKDRFNRRGDNLRKGDKGGDWSKDNSSSVSWTRKEEIWARKEEIFKHTNTIDSDKSQPPKNITFLTVDIAKVLADQYEPWSTEKQLLMDFVKQPNNDARNKYLSEDEGLIVDLQKKLQSLKRWFEINETTIREFEQRAQEYKEKATKNNLIIPITRYKIELKKDKNVEESGFTNLFEILQKIKLFFLNKFNFAIRDEKLIIAAHRISQNAIKKIEMVVWLNIQNPYKITLRLFTLFPEPILILDVHWELNKKEQWAERLLSMLQQLRPEESLEEIFTTPLKDFSAKDFS